MRNEQIFRKHYGADSFSVYKETNMYEQRKLVGFGRTTRTRRRYLISNTETFLFASYYAATVEIQRMIRGFLCRKHLKESEPVYLNKKKELEKEKQREIRELYSDVTEKMKLSDQTSEEFLKRYRSVVQARVSCVLYQFFHGPKIQRNVRKFGLLLRSSISSSKLCERSVLSIQEQRLLFRGASGSIEYNCGGSMAPTYL